MLTMLSLVPEEAAFNLYTQSEDMFRQGAFNLGTNLQELQQRIDYAENVERFLRKTQAKPMHRQHLELIQPLEMESIRF